MEAHAYDIQARVENWHWWFAARRKILFSLLKSRSIINESQKIQILDVGCGTGKNLADLSAHGHAVGLDSAHQALRYASGKNIRFLTQASCSDLPFAEKKFDLITSLDILEHLDNDVAALREFYRALKPGGYLLVSVPAFSWLWSLQDKISQHKRRYKKRELIEKLTTARFQIEKVTYFNSFLFLPIFIGRLLLKILPHHFKSENEIVAPGLNGLLKTIFSSEAWFLKRMDFPIGVSILALAQKPNDI